ncbi:hypothetical protein [Bifidobacterium sp.]|jgi:intracellular sulfur oxidation DsrE/DsrF family protein|uniref:hypothetical protein n=1 Tax=Bifidobacterium sp. TaxID=41200 RepID=UPI0025C1B054|nr:hypothetical protein [Bifidobacterium sp.]MCH4209709.1 hypothetical protein [Bifidobacterium sp.]MCI1224521.1 hypothetical protein [Bifidobacterium sp.]
MSDNNEFVDRPVLLHASDDGKDVARGLGLASGILSDPGCADCVLLVVNHNAVEGLHELDGADVPDGLTVVACAKALRTHGILPASLDPRIEVVPSGIVFIAQQQRDHGWYIRL